MADLEKVIKGIDICLQSFRCGEDCPYYNTEKIGCMEQLREDAIEQMKEYAVIKEEKQTQEDKGGILYHHYCIYCGWDWWTDEAFPNRCSKCDCELI